MTLTTPLMSTIYLIMNYKLRRSRRMVRINLSISYVIVPPKKSMSDNEDADSLRSNLRNILKNLKLIVNKMHIRFEDDYFSNGESK